MSQLQVVPALSTEPVPLATVTSDIDVQWEESVIHRFDRRRTITVQASPDGVTFPQLLASVKADFEAIELPPGYQLDWDGEWKSSMESQRGLVPGFAPAIVVMTLIIVMLFNAFRPPLIIFAVIPFAAIGSAILPLTVTLAPPAARLRSIGSGLPSIMSAGAPSAAVSSIAALL